MTHTYRLGAQLQAMAIDTVDLNRFGTHHAPSSQPGITTLSRHRIINSRRTVLVVARDADARLVAAATGPRPSTAVSLIRTLRTSAPDSSPGRAPSRRQRTGGAAAPPRTHPRRRVLPQSRLDPRS